MGGRALPKTHNQVKAGNRLQALTGACEKRIRSGLQQIFVVGGGGGLH